MPAAPVYFPLQGRGIGELGVVEALPDTVVAAFALVTQLGDLWFYFLAISLLYLLGRHVAGGVLTRERAAFVVALAVGASALTTATKYLFAFPRPPGAETAVGAALFPQLVRPLYEAAATADGFGFPSGHATGATVVYGGLALLADVGTRRQRAVAAGTVVGLVSLSRVVLGVHYVADVVAGAALGATYLTAVYLLGDRGARPLAAFVVAALVASAALLTTAFAFDGVAVAGAAVGGTAGWYLARDRVAPLEEPRRVALLAIPGLLVLGVGFGVVYATEPTAPVSFVGIALVIAGVIALPVAARALGDALGWG